MDLSIRCACGGLRGTLRGAAPARGNRVVCYCADCQAFPRFLGCADRVLDARGGTDIFQTSAARLELDAGEARLACLRLTSEGVLRWYAACCRTPLGNTPGTREVPFVGLIVAACIDVASAGGSLERALGPVRAHVHTGAARDRAGLDTSLGLTLGAVANFARLMLAARLRGDQRRTPFFDPVTRAPRVTPYVLTPEEWTASRPAP